MRLVSWNVNGLRACLGKGFLGLLRRGQGADVICLQETKMRPEQADFDLPGYHRYWNSADKAGYSGTAVFTRQEPLDVTCDFGIDAHRHEGPGHHGGVPGVLSGVLLHPQLQGPAGPAGLPDGLGGRHPGLSAGAGREEARGVLRGPERGPSRRSDIKNPGPNRRNPGFTDEEREKMTRLLASGFTDTFRYLYPGPDRGLLLVELPLQRPEEQRRVADRLLSRVGAAEGQDPKRRHLERGDRAATHCPVVLELDV